MNRLFTAAAIALSIGVATVPAFASTSLLPRLAEVDATVRNVQPEFTCEPDDKNDCAQQRVRVNDKGEIFATFDYASGQHRRCFWATTEQTYGLCQVVNGWFGPSATWPVVNGTMGVETDDPRCKMWGASDTAEYLSCFAAADRADQSQGK